MTFSVGISGGCVLVLGQHILSAQAVLNIGAMAFANLSENHATIIDKLCEKYFFLHQVYSTYLHAGRILERRKTKGNADIPDEENYQGQTLTQDQPLDQNCSLAHKANMTY